MKLLDKIKKFLVSQKKYVEFGLDCTYISFISPLSNYNDQNKFEVCLKDSTVLVFTSLNEDAITNLRDLLLTNMGYTVLYLYREQLDCITLKILYCE